MRALLDVLLLAIDLYWWVIIVAAVFSWLFAFNVVNARNEVVATISRMLYQLTEPVLRPIRRVLPDIGGLDLSPLMLLFGLFFLRQLIVYNVYPYAV